MINDVLVPGLVFGSLYGLVALGLTVFYRPTHVLNFAQGDLVMLGAMTMAAVTAGTALPWPVTAVGVAAAVAAVALVEERVAVAPVLRRTAHGVGWVITTLAFSLVVNQLIGRLWTDEPREVAPPAPLSLDTLTVAGVRFNSYQLAVVLVASAVVVALELHSRTRTGCAVRAVAVDRDAARLRGIDPGRLRRRAFLLGGALAGLTGVLAAPLTLASVTMGFGLLVKGFFAAVVGGIGDFRGALLGGWIVGVIEASGANYVSPGLQTTVLFAVTLAILMVRPEGLRRSGVERRV
ncbi:branched-chain amino acid ABC transporter permease [Streptomyces sp. HC44]|uniref:Branched-chain amino acid ABC transporter permease n=1 Tax=Streptomyces scabichelini TaxID=2711217 RepID=A0A6G4VBZ8_9ACTN|nr:branched-chain amino acid ABC transporter permease [Streptomyces scabichelini]NGO11586.1 branched-chain amino acid ABC transporter permease [Streptomyces scabichelini]